MHIVIIGRGKLASELITGLSSESTLTVTVWPETTVVGGPSVVVHAGSGRELQSVIQYCEQTGSALIELATGSQLETRPLTFPVVLCPNTNLLMLKVVSMLTHSGHLFRGNVVRVVESHQAGKSTAPGTAVAIASALGLPASEVVSVRDPSVQRTELAIPEEHLGRHAVHRIHIQDGFCTATIETRVLGSSPYVQGVRDIVKAVGRRKLDARVYLVTEFLENGWLQQSEDA